MAGDSFVYLSATLGSLVVGLVSGVVTARALGPADRGTYSVVVFLVGLANVLATVGLGDAAVFEVRNKGRRLESVAGTTLTAVLLASVLAGGVAAVAVALTVDVDPLLLLASSSAVVAAGLTSLMSSLLLAAEGSRVSSIGLLVVSCATTAALVVLLVGLQGGVAAAVSAGTLGSLVGGAVLHAALRRRGVVVRPRRLDWGYVKQALRYGIALQLGTLLTAVAARFDLLVVYSLLGRGPAGRYSVALTMAMLAATPGSSVSWGAFPQLAGTSATAAPDLVRRSLRAGLAISLLSAPPLAAAAVVAIPLVYGPDYAPAAAPGAVLVIAGTLTGMQYLAARLAAAQGRPRALPMSFGAFLAVMLSADFLLIPVFGLSGAATAAVIAATAGVGVALRELAQAAPGSLTRGALPGLADLRELVRLPLTMLPALGRKP